MRTRFLIVDDSDLVRKGLRTVLQANPEWEVCGEAADGLAAVEIFKEVRPTIVMFTQHANAELEKRAMDAGIRSVVSKTDAFPMVGIIEALLGPVDPKPSAEGTL